jgi:periplasmic protein CpxP/Spy
MKPAKKIIACSLVLGGLLAGHFSRAQDAATNAPAAGATTNQPPPIRRVPPMDIAKILDLTDDQKAKALPILDAQRQQIIALVQDTTLSPDDRRAKIKAVRDNTASQLKAILTPDQFQKWQRMQPHIIRMAPPPGFGGTNGPPRP